MKRAFSRVAPPSWRQGAHDPAMREKGALNEAGWRVGMPLVVMWIDRQPASCVRAKHPQRSPLGLGRQGRCVPPLGHSGPTHTVDTISRRRCPPPRCSSTAKRFRSTGFMSSTLDAPRDPARGGRPPRGSSQLRRYRGGPRQLLKDPAQRTALGQAGQARAASESVGIGSQIGSKASTPVSSRQTRAGEGSVPRNPGFRGCRLSLPSASLGSRATSRGWSFIVRKTGT